MLLRTAKYAKTVSNLTNPASETPLYSGDLPTSALRGPNGKRIPRYMVDPENATAQQPWNQAPTALSIRLYRKATQPRETRGVWDVRHDKAGLCD